MKEVWHDKYARKERDRDRDREERYPRPRGRQFRPSTFTYRPRQAPPPYQSQYSQFLQYSQYNQQTYTAPQYQQRGNDRPQYPARPQYSNARPQYPNYPTRSLAGNSSLSAYGNNPPNVNINLKNAYDAPKDSKPNTNKGYQGGQQSNPQARLNDQRPRERQSYIPRPKAFQGHEDHGDNDTHEEETEYYENEAQDHYDGYYAADHDYNQNQDVEESDPEVTANLVSNITGIACKICKVKFSSGNKFHKHIRQGGCTAPPEQPVFIPLRKEPSDQSDEPTAFHTTLAIIKSTAAPEAEPGFGFRNWRYRKVNIILQPKGSIEQVCLDTGYTMSLVDREFLSKLLPNIVIQKLSTSITVRGIGSATHPCDEFVSLDIYMPGMIQGKPHLAHIKRDFHIVVHLKAKMLLGMDLIGPEMIDTNIKRRVATIGSCQGLEVPLYIKPRQGGKIKRVVRAKAKVIIAPHTVRNVDVKVADLPKERDLTFTPDHNNATNDVTCEAWKPVSSAC